MKPETIGSLIEKAEFKQAKELLKAQAERQREERLRISKMEEDYFYSRRTDKFMMLMVSLTVLCLLLLTASVVFKTFF